MKLIYSSLIIFFSTGINAQFDSLIWDSIERTYLVHLPSGFNGSENLPLVIAMHGGFGSADNLQNQSQLGEKADEEHFIVVYPEGVQGGVFDIRTWNAGWCCGHASTTDVDDVGFINALLDKLIDDFPIDTDRIYATGMSNGGFMSYRLACELSHRIAAIAPVAASMSMVNCSPDRMVPVLDFHSYLDFNVPIEGGFGIGPSTHYSSPLDSVMNVWSDLNACQNENDTIISNNQFTHIAWTNCACNYQVEQYITEDGGHSWPGGQPTPLGDPGSNYINANDVMWEFFERYSLDCSPNAIDEVGLLSDVILFPNPANNTLFIRTEQNVSDLLVSIYDLMGNEMHSSKGHNEIDVSQLSNGTYILRIEMGEVVWNRKFLKVE